MLNSIRILIVEDTRIAQLVVKAYMTHLGCIVDIAEDGRSAIESTAQTQYNLILMDIGLGDGPNGFETTQYIKSHSPLNKDTPIIALTSHGDSDIRQKAADVGMILFLRKPFTTANAQQVMDYLIK
ncbi:MAG: Transcriptional regulatory protein HprR [Legionella sp.]|uniref:response regulator n=1 Tax=Legionella sp. TaxID=459 RepID=UPI003D117DEB